MCVVPLQGARCGVLEDGREDGLTEVEKYIERMREAPIRELIEEMEKLGIYKGREKEDGTYKKEKLFAEFSESAMQSQP